jgi:hypothetical protein
MLTQPVLCSIEPALCVTLTPPAPEDPEIPRSQAAAACRRAYAAQRSCRTLAESKHTLLDNGVSLSDGAAFIMYAFKAGVAIECQVLDR